MMSTIYCSLCFNPWPPAILNRKLRFDNNCKFRGFVSNTGASLGPGNPGIALARSVWPLNTPFSSEQFNKYLNTFTTLTIDAWLGLHIVLIQYIVLFCRFASQNQFLSQFSQNWGQQQVFHWPVDEITSSLECRLTFMILIATTG